MKNAPKQFIEILKTVRDEKGESLQIPYKMKNGKPVDEVFFHLLQYMGDNEPMTVIETTKDKLVLEIYYQGICNMIDAFDRQRQEEQAKKRNVKIRKGENNY